MNDKRILSLISLSLLLMALLLTWPLAAIGNAEAAFSFAGVAALLSLGLAMLSRSEYFSRIVLWSIGLTFGLAAVGGALSVPIWLARESTSRALAVEAVAVARDQQMRAELAAKQLQARKEQSNGSETNGVERDSQKDASSSISVDEELGIVTIKGTKEDVQKTVATLDKIQKAATKNSENNSMERTINGWPVPNTLERLTFPKELQGNWRIQDATTLASKRLEYIGEIAIIDQDSLLLTTGDHSNLYRLSHWKHREDDQSIEADLTAVSPSGQASKTFRCLMEIRGEELLLLRPQKELSSRPNSVDDATSSITRFQMVREAKDSSPDRSIEQARDRGP